MHFIRHGQSTFNIVFDQTGSDPEIPDAPLSPKGLKQAEAAANLLSNKKISTIISSPYTRALQTASTIADVLDLPIQADPLVGERRLYSCDIGAPLSSLRKNWPKVDFNAVENENWWLPFGEKQADLERRTKAFISKWKNDISRKNILVVSHWYFICAISGHNVENAEVVYKEIS